MEQNSKTEKTFTARATCFSGRLGSYRFSVDSDGSVRVYDSIAGHYTRCHGMTKRAEARIRRMAR